MPSIIVASDKPKAGKTMVSSVLSTYLASKGHEVSAMGSMFDESEAVSSIPEWLDDVEVIGGVPEKRPASPSSDQIRKVAEKIKAHSKGKVLVVESHLKTPRENNELAQASESKVIYVSSIDSKMSRTKEAFGDRLLGVVLNNVPRYRMDLVKKTPQEVPVISYISENRHMVSSTVDQFARHLEGKYLYESDKKDELVLNVLIGGLVLDWSVLYFQSKKDVLAVIRGDRPDLHLGALQSGNVHALMLTQGIEPIEYVYYEAKELEIPIILVSTDTHETMDLIPGIVDKAKFDHPRKLNHALKEFEANIRQEVVDKVLGQITL